MNTRKILASVVLTGALIAGLTACGTSGAPSSDTKPVATHSASASPSQAPAASQNAKFGSSYKYTDGIEVTISTPQPFTPSASAAGTVPGDQNVVFKITVTNNSKSNVDASTSEFSLTSGGVAASAISDLENPAAGDGFGPQTPILPGQSVSWQNAWAVKSTSDLTGSFNLEDFQHNAAIFTN